MENLSVKARELNEDDVDYYLFPSEVAMRDGVADVDLLLWRLSNARSSAARFYREIRESK